jgi:hypothetical protein
VFKSYLLQQQSTSGVEHMLYFAGGNDPTVSKDMVANDFGDRPRYPAWMRTPSITAGKRCIY